MRLSTALWSRSRWSALALAVGLVLAAGCSSSPADPDGGRDVRADDGREDDLPTDGAPDGAPDADGGPPPDMGPLSADCDPLDPAACSLPWPSNLYLLPDAKRATGFGLAFGPTTLPANNDDEHIDPAAYEHLDGYAVSTPIMLLVPNLDPALLPSELEIERSLDKDAAILLFRADPDGSLTRVPYFAELDSRESDPARKLLFVRPAVILEEATRYVVAFRNLETAAGEPIAAGAAFASLRDGKPSGNDELDKLLEPRRARFEEVFGMLEKAGVERSSLYLAWDFVTASSAALHGRLLAMRDLALAAAGKDGPVLTVTNVSEFAAADDGSGKPVDENIAVEVEGTFEVPSYLKERDPGTGFELNLDESGMPAQNGTRNPRFWVRIPHSAVNGGPPHGLVMYGHGLLGSGDQVRGGFNGRIANQHNLIFFAADLTGMSSAEIPSVLATLNNMSEFVTIAGPLHQGLVEWVLLTRAMRQRLGTLKELAKYNITVNTDEVFYSGISQGGIFGGTFVTISPDVDRGHLGVPGSNYSLLLGRSSDFIKYYRLLDNTYPAAIDQNLVIATIQLLWESTEPVSYYRHLSAEPFPGQRPKAVLLAPAKGDYQVAVLSNEILARTDIGVALLENYDDERTVFGVTPVPYPHTGSGIVLYDFGNAWPPPGNLVPRDMLGDPHGLPRQADHHNQQLVTFLRTGEIIDVCGGDGCHPE